MSDELTNTLTEAFQEARPVVLFAGQNFDMLAASRDPVLESLLSRLKVKADHQSWSAALDAKLSQSDMDWLSERFSRSVSSEAAQMAYDLPWSAVFTSSIDPNFARKFETRGRQPEAVLAGGTYARVSRSRSRPPIYYLLGRAGDTAPDASAPKSRADLKRRTSLHTTELLNRVAETATARGVIVIAGYDPASDWLPLDELLAPLSDAPGIKILLFGGIDLEKSAFATEMVAAGSLIPESNSFANALASAGAIGWAEFSASAAPDEPSVVSVTGGLLDVTPALRLRVEASAAVVDDGWTAEPDPLDTSANEEAFRRFHGDLGGFRTRVEGIARGYAMQRDFEADLLRVVELTLRRLAQTDGVVLVHGQSGTGKSIALARLAREIRERLQLPVLVATTRIPTHADIDGFCVEAERMGATATVLLCDTNHPLYRYRELASALQSRGRKLLIVGTSYRVEPRLQGGSRQYVEAPSTISTKEIAELKNILGRYEPRFVVSSASPGEGPSALAMLYRSISHGREHIRARMNAEARSAEGAVRERAAKVPTPAKRSHLADQLIAAGIADENSQIFASDSNGATLGLDAAGRLIDFVMVAGRLNCPVPLNLIIRILSQNSGSIEIDQAIHLFSGLDIFRWHTANAEGTELLISPRLQLEAELICRSRFGDRRHEIERLIELISAVRSGGVDRQIERSFLLDLLQKIDRDGPRGDEYREGYLAFGEALTTLRQRHGVIDGPLMVRECVFRRQAVWSQDGANTTVTLGEDKRLAILDAARSIVEEAFRLIDAGELHASKRTRQSLASERASIYGYLAVQRSRLDDEDGSWSDYLAAKAASARAMAMTDEYYPIDIALWTSSDMLKGSDLPDDKRADVIADLYATLDLVDPNLLGADQQVRYFDRQARIGVAIGNSELSAAALANLESVAPAAATFLVARQLASPLEKVDPPYTSDQRKLAASAADYIASRKAADVSDDARCQRLLLRLRWAQATGERLLRSERGITPADPAQISDILSIVSGINDRSGLASRNTERYLEAVLAWLAKDTGRAIDMWKSLSRDSEFEDRSRVIRRLLASDAAGAPIKYRGRVEGVKGKNDWKIRVEGLNISINLLGHEFSEHDLAHGRELRDFGIAFNYVGPVADPLTRPVSRR
ncbi:hypothetical protein AB4099_12815 [Bosea sp. 2KB_26]|uniref:hypothetical protein n=1 Tax=Bosea sp. 2KB_26 TaxID=3237475 RepID=UPI003F93A2DD